MNNFKGNNFKDLLEKLKSEKIEEYDGVQNVHDYMKMARRKIINAVGELPELIIQPNIASSQLHHKIFRVRLASEINNSFLRSEYSYPPMTACSNQRANLAKNPVFYGSSNPTVCVFETIKQSEITADTIFCISVWSIDPNKKFSVAPYVIDTIDETNEFYTLSQSILKKFPLKLANKFSNEEINYKLDLIKLFSSLFVSDDIPFISSIIAFEFLYVPNKINTDILIYPSLQLNKKEINYAINPNFVDESMTLDRVYQVSIRNIDFNNGNPIYQMGIQKYAFMKNSRLIWNIFDKANEEEMSIIRSDFKGFIKNNEVKYTPY